MYSMGFNTNGVLGLGLTEQELRHAPLPQLVKTLYCIETVVAGAQHSLALDVTKTVYGWGSTEFSAIGDSCHQNILTPKELIIDDKQIKIVQAGADHSVFVSQDNEVYAMGRNDRG